MEKKKMLEWACPPECGAGLRWNEGDFTKGGLDQILDLSAKHMVRSHGYKDNAETREVLRKAIKPVERLGQDFSCSPFPRFVEEIRFEG